MVKVHHEREGSTPPSTVLEYNGESTPIFISINTLVQPKSLPIVLPKDIQVDPMSHKFAIFDDPRDDDPSRLID